MSYIMQQIKHVRKFDVIQLVNLGKNKTQLTLRNEKNKFDQSDLTLTVYISYKTAVAFRVNDTIFKTSKFHSNTTSRHINLWIESQKNIDMIFTRPQDVFDTIINKSGLTL